MGFSWKKSSAKNPQSGANSVSSSSGGKSSDEYGTHGSESSDNVPTVNLTEQRLQDWKAGGVLMGGANGGNPTPYAAGGNSNNNVNAATHSNKPKSSPPASTSPNQLILLIERGDWNGAIQRAATHEHEVRQLVKLRKTTKSTSAQPKERSSSTSKRHVQISNVKCLALHHACQKLRSVHTTIYQKNNVTANDTAALNANNNTRRIIDEDEYISACKLILTLIRIYPEACKERESRHGCLPFHLCVFSMCATPPPNTGMVQNGPNNNSVGGSPSKHNRNQSHHDLPSPTRGPSKRPPINNTRSTSAPLSLLPSLDSKGSKGGHGHHRKDSNNSGDFSLGNISQMIMEESEHQQALTAHKEQQSAASSSGEGNGMMGGIEEQIYKGVENMEKFLIGLETRYEMKEDKKKRDKDNNKRYEKETTTTTTTVVNAMTPMDRLDERSRETDSHSSPHVSGSSNGGTIGTDDRTGADALPSASTWDGSVATKHSEDVSFTATTVNKNNTTNKGDTTAASNNAYMSTSSEPTIEDLQRQYLQINNHRRDDYSVRVLNALLDAWPKSIRTSSEGGRLPLHMACFGKATVKVMENILKAYPDAARQRNHDGFLPIHIAAHWGVSHPDVAPLILRAYPDGAVGRNRWERTPIEEALGMAGENGRQHQLSLVWSLRRHPTYWIHNDIGSMLLPRNVRTAPWRLVDAGDYNPNNFSTAASTDGSPQRLKLGGGSGAVDVDEVGSSTDGDEDEGVEVSMAKNSSIPNIHDPVYVQALADATDLSLLITRDKHWKAAALRCRSHPQEACESMEVKVRGAYTAKITPLHYACENKPSVEVIRALLESNPDALERRQEPGGQLPLHAASTWGASSEVISTLLSARPSCAEMKDFLSNLPLHCACYSGASTVVIEALLRVYPQSVWPRNHQGSSAIDIVRRLGHGNRREVLRLLEQTQGKLLQRAIAGKGEAGAQGADK